MGKKNNVYKMMETTEQTRLNPCLPCVIRVDGRAFSKLTKHLQRPFDPTFTVLMNRTTLMLADNLPECRLAYTQSDEISLILSADPTPWFNWRRDKLLSVTASLATAAFNTVLHDVASAQTPDRRATFEAMIDMLPSFDARLIPMPKEMLAGYVINRQIDAKRNAVSQAARQILAKSEMHKASTSWLERELARRGHDVEGISPRVRNGAIAWKVRYVHTGKNPMTGEEVACMRRRWMLDEMIPDFSNPENRERLETLIQTVLTDDLAIDDIIS